MQSTLYDALSIPTSMNVNLPGPANGISVNGEGVSGFQPSSNGVDGSNGNNAPLVGAVGSSGSNVGNGSVGANHRQQHVKNSASMSSLTGSDSAPPTLSVGPAGLGAGGANRPGVLSSLPPHLTHHHSSSSVATLSSLPSPTSAPPTPSTAGSGSGSALPTSSSVAVFPSPSGPLSPATPGQQQQQQHTFAQQQQQQQQQAYSADLATAAVQQQVQQQQLQQGLGQTNPTQQAAVFAAPIAVTATANTAASQLGQQQQQLYQQLVAAQQQQQQQPSNAHSAASAGPSNPASRPSSSVGQGQGQTTVHPSIHTQQPQGTSTGGISVAQDRQQHQQGTSGARQHLDIALRACEDLANIYNRIANVLTQGTSLELPERLALRQEFVGAVASLDRAFFLSPSGQGFVGIPNETVSSVISPMNYGSSGPSVPNFLAMSVSGGGGRKRAFTLGSADGGDAYNSHADPNKHRRMGSEAVTSNFASPMMASNHSRFAGSQTAPATNSPSPTYLSAQLSDYNVIAAAQQAVSVASASPRSSNGSAPSTAFSVVPQRPPLFQHTHSSPLLPVESHYRAGSSGISEAIPAPKASDLAASGSHHIGKLAGPTPLSTSSLLPGSQATEAFVDSTLSQQQQQQQQHHLHHTLLASQSQPSAMDTDTRTQDDTTASLSSALTTPTASTEEDARLNHQGGILAPTPQVPILLPAQLSSNNPADYMTLQQQQQSMLQSIGAAVPQHQPATMPGGLVQVQPQIDPQAYARQALNAQQVQLAAQQQAAIVSAAAAAGIQILPVQQAAVSQSTTPVPFGDAPSTGNSQAQPAGQQNEQQQITLATHEGVSAVGTQGANAAAMSHIPAYITPPTASLAQFPQQPVASQYGDVDMSASSGPSEMHRSTPASAIAPQQHSAAKSSTKSHQSVPSLGSVASMDLLRASNPGSLSVDFSTLRGLNDEDFNNLTSPFTSSQTTGTSFSSFPFSATTPSVNGSRSRATSVSRNTSASRSRAPSATSNTHPHLTPDAIELENILGSLNPSLPSPINEDDYEDDDPFYENQAGDNATLMDGQAGSGSNAMKKDAISPELMQVYNDIFYKWLPAICSDLEATDRKGEKIHQPLMAKKMAKLDEEHAFRPFKFRIQPFTNGFQDACRDAGLSEQDVAPKLIKHYLWNQPLISRFNDEGKKTKSKGNHVWSVEARYIDVGHYEYRPPPPKIVPIPTTAAPGVPFSWTPKVLDSQCQGPPMDAEFSSPALPTWLSWKDNTLAGTPPMDALSVSIDIVADYAECCLTQNFTIAVVGDDGVRAFAPDSQPPHQGRSEHVSSSGSVNETPITTMKADKLYMSGSSGSSAGLANHSASMVNPPATYAHLGPGQRGVMYAGSGISVLQQPQGSLLPSPMPPSSLGMQAPSIAAGQGAIQPLQTNNLRSNLQQSSPSSPVSPQHASFAAAAVASGNAASQPALQQQQSSMAATQQMLPASALPQAPTHHIMPTQPVPFYLPTHPSDATTLASASHIKAKLVEQTTVHHENLSTLDPSHPPADPRKVSAAVDAAISHQIAVTAQVPSMPSASEVFNATLEVSARSQQMQQEQLTHAVAAVTGQLPLSGSQLSASGQHALLDSSGSSGLTQPVVQQLQQPQQQLLSHAQVTSQLADFSFTTPCNTPATRSPDGPFQMRALPQDMA